MKSLLEVLKRYKFALLSMAILIILFIVKRPIGKEASENILQSFKEFFKITPPLFIILGLMDIWIPEEKFAKYMGKRSGILGVLISLIAGALCVGPLYMTFPIGAILLRKRASIKNVLIFIGASSSIKIPEIIVEIYTLGVKFTFVRLGIEIIGIILIGWIIDKRLPRREKEIIFKKSKYI